MLDLRMITSLCSDQDQYIAYYAQQSLAIAQNYQQGKITAEESTMLLKDLQQQARIYTASSDLNRRAEIDNSLSDMIQVLGVASGIIGIGLMK